MKRDFRQELTDAVIAALEKGTAPWQKPWDDSPFSRPMNAVSKRRYNGANALYLSLLSQCRGGDDPRWCTYRQAEAQGWQVHKGERGTPIEYWGFTRSVPVEDEDGNPVLDADGKPLREEVRCKRPFVRYFFVFHVSQMDGVPALPVAPGHEWDPVEKAERLLRGSQATLKHHDHDNEARYMLQADEIHLPRPSRFSTPELYYATALHELAHWTRHPSRLDRPRSGGFGSPEYAKEELRAEIASLFLSAETGLPHDVGRHAAYVGSWIKALKEDKNEIFRAARDANKISEYILAFDPERGRQLAEESPTRVETAGVVAPEPEEVAALAPPPPVDSPRLPAAPVMRPLFSERVR